MSTGGAILLPLDSYGGLGARGRSGVSNSLHPLASEGAAYHHSSGEIILPALTATFTVTKGPSFSLDRPLPRLTARGYGGANAPIVLPRLFTTAAGTVIPIARLDAELPMLTVTGGVTVGARWGMETLLPPLSGEAYGGSNLAAELPMLEAIGSTWALETSALDRSLPMLSMTGTMSVYSMPFSAAIVLPALIAPYCRAEVALPRLDANSVFRRLLQEYEAWVLNVRNGGVTRWTNTPFTQILQHGDQTLFVGDGNLYVLGGDLDGDDAPIQWSFETGLDDLGKPGVKHIPYLYLDGIIDGEVQITLLDDRGREFAYEYTTGERGAVHMPHRRKLGNGVRTRNVGFRISSTAGAYIELDALEPEATITQRSV